MKILVTGAGGFIGHHLVKHLREQGHFVHGVDIKLPEFTNSVANHLDMRTPEKHRGMLLWPATVWTKYTT